MTAELLDDHVDTYDLRYPADPHDDTLPSVLAWQERALCAETDPDAFFPEKGGSTRAAKQICLACEVRVECLDYALATDERFGIWGGLSEEERQGVRRQRRGSRGAA